MKNIFRTSAIFVAICAAATLCSADEVAFQGHRLHSQLSAGLAATAKNSLFKNFPADSDEKPYIEAMMSVPGRKPKADQTAEEHRLEMSIEADLKRIAMEHANLACSYPKPTRTTRPLYMEAMGQGNKKKELVTGLLRGFKGEIEEQSRLFCDRYVVSQLGQAQ